MSVRYDHDKSLIENIDDAVGPRLYDYLLEVAKAGPLLVTNDRRQDAYLLSHLTFFGPVEAKLLGGTSRIGEPWTVNVTGLGQMLIDRRQNGA